MYNHPSMTFVSIAIIPSHLDSGFTFNIFLMIVLTPKSDVYWFCFEGGGCGVGVGIGWGFGTAFGSQYRSSRITFQGVEFDSKEKGISNDVSKGSPQVLSS